jgi:hypothetical protein
MIRSLNKMDSSNKQNWLIELTDIKNQERVDFIKFVRDPLNHNSTNLVVWITRFHETNQKRLTRLQQK